MIRRFVVLGRDVRDNESGALALFNDRATALTAARLMNDSPELADDYQWCGGAR